MTKTFVFTAALFASASLGHAIIIQPDAVTASSQHSANYAPIHTIDGSGLLGPVTSLPDHAAYTSTSNHWTAQSGELLNAWIKWSFNTAQTLDTIYVWNHQSNGPAGNDGYDVGAFTLTFFDALDSEIGTFSGTLAYDSPSAQAFDFGELSGISSVRFDINSVQSSTTWTGLAEVAFGLNESVSVPDSSTTASLLVLALAGLGLVARRRQLG